MSSYYKILEVSPDATMAQIRIAYYRLALQWHPDKNPTNQKEEAHAKFTLLTEAYETLTDEKMRAEYDRSLGYTRSTASRQLQNESLAEQLDNPNLTYDGAKKIVDQWIYQFSPRVQEGNLIQITQYVLNHITFGEEALIESKAPVLAHKTRNAQWLFWAILSFSNLSQYEDLLRAIFIWETLSKGLYNNLFKQLPAGDKQTIIDSLTKMEYGYRCKQKFSVYFDKIDGAQGFLFEHYKNNDEFLANFIVESCLFFANTYRCLPPLYTDLPITKALFLAIYNRCQKEITLDTNSYLQSLQNRYRNYSGFNFNDLYGPIIRVLERAMQYFYGRFIHPDINNPKETVVKDQVLPNLIQDYKTEIKVDNEIFTAVQNEIKQYETGFFDTPATKALANLVENFTPCISGIVWRLELLALYLLLHPYMEEDNKILGYQSALATRLMPSYTELKSNVNAIPLLELYRLANPQQTELLENAYSRAKSTTGVNANKIRDGFRPNI